MKRSLVAAFALAFTLGVLASAAAAAPPADEILFVGPAPGSDPGFGSSLAVLAIRADGTGMRVVLPRTTRETPTSPRWSPDGSRIVVAAEGLVVASGNGAVVHRLTVGLDVPVSWSPDGRWIAFIRRSRTQATSELYVVTPSGNRMRRLAAADSASWAPDSRRLVVARRGHDLVVAGVAGGLRAIPGTRPGAGAAWSPDGSWIAFSSYSGPMSRPTGAAIAAIHPNGSGRRWLTQPRSGRYDDEPVWSPGSGRVAYTRERFDEDLDHSEIRVVTRDGRNLGNMDSHRGDHDQDASWSPDGTRLVFIRDAAVEPNGQATRLLVAVAQTGSVRVIADYPYRGSASWRPAAGG